MARSPSPVQTNVPPVPASPPLPRRRRQQEDVPALVSDIAYDPPVSASELALVLAVLGDRIAAILRSDDDEESCP